MAKQLPDATALQRRLAPSETPGINAGQLRFGQIDYSAAASGGRALGDGMARLGQGLALYAKQQEEIEDYDTKKRLLDFRLETELAHEEFKRTMPPGGAGYAEAWQKEYARRAKEFVGADDKNIPERERGRVGMALKQHEVMLSERAQRAALGEQDRYEIETLGNSLESRKSAVAEAPDQLDRLKAEAYELIDKNPRLSPAAKAKLRKEYVPGLIEEAYRGRASNAKTIDEYKAILDELKPEMGDRGTDDPSYLGSKGPASVRFNNPGAQYPGEIARKFGSTQTETIGGGHKIAVFPDAVSGAAAQFALLDSKYTGKTMRQAIAMWSGGNSVDTYLQVIERETGIKPGQVLTKEMIANPEIAIPIARAMAVQEAGKEYPLSPEQWSKAHSWAMLGQKPEPGVIEGGYDGPHAELTQKQRRKLYNVIKDEQNKTFAGLHAMLLKQQEDDIGSVRRTGKSATDYDPEFARKILDPNQMKRWEINRKEAEYEYEMASGLERLTPEAIAEKIERVKPEPGEESYKAHARTLDRVIKFAGELQKLRDDDPAAAVDAGPLMKIGGRTIEADPEVTAARQGQYATQKEKSIAIMSARIRAQAKLGIPPEAQSPITKDDAKRILAPIAGLKSDEMAKGLQDIVVKMDREYGPHAQAALRYIAREIYRDTASRDIVFDEMNKMIKAGGNANLYDPVKLKELEEINRREGMRRGSGGTMQPSAAEMARPNQSHIKMLLENPHMAPMFDKKFGEGSASQILKAAGAGRAR